MSDTVSSGTSEGLRIARNSALLGAGNAAGLVLGFATTVLVTDQLGEARYGLFLGAQRFVLFFLVIAQFGLHPLLVRAVSSRRDDVGALLGTVLALRGSLGLGFAAAVATAAIVGDYLPGYRGVLAAVALMELLGVFAETFVAVCEGWERMGRSALVSLLRSLVTFVGIGLAALLGGGLEEFVAVYLVARAVQLVGAVWLTRNAVPDLRLRVHWAQVVPILREAIPYVAIGFSYMALRSIDVMMLARFSTIPEASHYGAALNFVDVLLVVPLLAQRALLPAFSRLESTGSATAVARDTLIVFTGLLLPASVGLALLAASAVALYPSGEFAEAAPVLQVLCVALLFMGPNTVCATLLTGAGRLWSIVAGYAVALPVQVLANFLLLFEYGAIGVAAGTVIAHVLLVSALVVASRGVGFRLPVAALARQVLASALMAGAVWTTLEGPVVIPIALGALVYVAALLVLAPPDSVERRVLGMLRDRLWKR